MAGTELATAYLTLIPSLRGATKQIESQLGGVDTTAAAKKIGSGARAGHRRQPRPPLRRLEA